MIEKIVEKTKRAIVEVKGTCAINITPAKNITNQDIYFNINNNCF